MNSVEGDDVYEVPAIEAAQFFQDTPGIYQLEVLHSISKEYENIDGQAIAEAILPLTKCPTSRSVEIGVSQTEDGAELKAIGRYNPTGDTSDEYLKPGDRWGWGEEDFDIEGEIDVQTVKDHDEYYSRRYDNLGPGMPPKPPKLHIEGKTEEDFEEINARLDGEVLTEA